MPKGATVMTPLGNVAPLNADGPLGGADPSGAPMIVEGAWVQTPGGPGTVSTAPAEGRVSVDVGGLASSFPLSDVEPIEDAPSPASEAPF